MCVDPVGSPVLARYQLTVLHTLSLESRPKGPFTVPSRLPPCTAYKVCQGVLQTHPYSHPSDVAGQHITHNVQYLRLQGLKLAQVLGLLVPASPEGPGQWPGRICCSLTIFGHFFFLRGWMIQGWISAILATHRVTGHPEGGISGQSGIFERILLSCIKGLLVLRPEPVDVDLDHLGGIDELHQQPQDPHPIRCCISIQ